MPHLLTLPDIAKAIRKNFLLRCTCTKKAACLMPTPDSSRRVGVSFFALADRSQKHVQQSNHCNRNGHIWPKFELGLPPHPQILAETNRKIHVPEVTTIVQERHERSSIAIQRCNGPTEVSSSWDCQILALQAVARFKCTYAKAIVCA